MEGLLSAGPTLSSFYSILTFFGLILILVGVGNWWLCFHLWEPIYKSNKDASVWLVAFVLFVPVGGDCSGLDGIVFVIFFG